MNLRIRGSITCIVSAMLLLAGSAGAAVIRSTPNEGDYTATTVASGTYHWFSIKDNGVRTTNLSGTSFGLGLEVGSSQLYIGLWNASVASDTRTGSIHYASNFAAGELINSGSFVESGSAYLFYGSDAKNEFIVGSSGYLGVTYFDTTDNKVHYGWARITRLSTGFTLHEWAYETLANTPIAAGSLSSIPEPATGAALAGLGMLGVAALRRRKR